MVTAGIFLLLRVSYVLEAAHYAKIMVLIFGALTALFGASVGAMQNDIKKVVAYSTCSQLGYMAVACGLGAYPLAAFHLYNHAFFKALLFLSAGSVIHGVSDEQDMRRMGGLAPLMPLSYLSFLVGSLSLMGLPFLTGFYSKDVILEFALVDPAYAFIYGLILMAAFFTAFYSFRLLVLVFWRAPQGVRRVFEGVHEPGVFMTTPLVVLLLATGFIGFLSKDFFIGLGSDFWGASLCVSNEYVGRWGLAEAALTPDQRNYPLYTSCAGALFAFVLLSTRALPGKLLRPFVFLLAKRWHWDSIYNRSVGLKVVKGFFYDTVFLSVDKGLLELVGAHGAVSALRSLASTAKKFHTGFIFDYLLFSILGVIAVAWSVVYYAGPVDLAVVFFVSLIAVKFSVEK